MHTYPDQPGARLYFTSMPWMNPKPFWMSQHKWEKQIDKDWETMSAEQRDNWARLQTEGLTSPPGEPRSARSGWINTVIMPFLLGVTVGWAISLLLRAFS